ncbi:MAG: ZIP family metal transporter [Clostridia bacterium]|nr:ZIP family metal transporter [Clostridia bacterium]
MSTIAWVIILTAIAGIVGTGLGGVVSIFVKKDSKFIVSLLLAFASGVMLAIVCFDLIVEAINLVSSQVSSILMVILGTVVGFFVIYLLNYMIDYHSNKEVEHIDANHPKTADDLDELIHADHLHKHKAVKSKPSHLFIAGVVMASAIALHNMPEGMAIGAVLASDSAQGILSSSGLSLAIVIGLHNIPEGMAVCVPLVAGGMNRVKAVVVTALCGAPTVIGALIGYTLGLINPIWLALSLSFAGGAMLYVVLGELLPESILIWRSKMPAVAALVGMLVGIAIIYM